MPLRVQRIDSQDLGAGLRAGLGRALAWDARRYPAF